MVSLLGDQQSTWCSHSDSYRRSVENRDDRCTSHSSIWPKLSTWSAEEASSLCCEESAVSQSSWGWSSPSMTTSRHSPLQRLFYQSKAGWNKDAYLRQHFSASSSPCCCPTPSANPKTASTSTPEPTETSSTSLDSGPRPRCTRCWWHWWHCRRWHCSGNALCGNTATTRRLLRTRLPGVWSDHQPQEDQNLASRRQQHPKHLHQRPRPRSRRFHLPWFQSNFPLDAELNTRIGKAATAIARLAIIPCWPSAPRWRCTKPMYSARCSTAVKRGHCILGKSADSTLSICTASEGFWPSPGKTAFHLRPCNTARFSQLLVTQFLKM